MNGTVERVNVQVVLSTRLLVYLKHSGPVIWTKTCLDFGLQHLVHLKIFP